MRGPRGVCILYILKNYTGRGDAFDNLGKNWKIRHWNASFLFFWYFLPKNRFSPLKIIYFLQFSTKQLKHKGLVEKNNYFHRGLWFSRKYTPLTAPLSKGWIYLVIFCKKIAKIHPAPILEISLISFKKIFKNLLQNILKLHWISVWKRIFQKTQFFLKLIHLSLHNQQSTYVFTISGVIYGMG